MSVRRRFVTLCAAGSLVAGTAFAAAPAANASTIGDGVTAPTHDSSLAVIPVCNLPGWLQRNFADHGNDIANYQLNPWSGFQIFSYALTDTLFHIPATIATLGGLTNPGKYC